MLDRLGALNSWLLGPAGHSVLYDPVRWLWRHPVTAGSIAAGILTLLLLGWLIDRPGKKE